MIDVWLKNGQSENSNYFISLAPVIKSGIGMRLSLDQERSSLELLLEEFAEMSFLFSWTTGCENELSLELTMAIFAAHTKMKLPEWSWPRKSQS